MFKESSTHGIHSPYNAPPPVPEGYSATLKIPKLNRMEILNIILSELECRGLPAERLFWVRLAIDEAIINAVTHGHGENTERPFTKVRIDCNVNDDSVAVRITDTGDGFNLSDVPDPTLDENLWNIEGRGIFLMRKAMDQVIYNDKGNSVLLIHEINGSQWGQGSGQKPPDT
jgi:serine/threonine-protein kinase RsbW